MSDNTELGTGSGGDVIRTISHTTSTQDTSTGVITDTEVKTQAIAIVTGAEQSEVSETNPLYVEDAKVRRLLETISEQLDQLIAAVESLQ